MSSDVRIGWIGLGQMGGRMLPHLLDAGHPVTFLARRDDAAAPFVERGAVRLADPAAVAEASDVIITIVAMPADVEQVHLGERGLLTGEVAGRTFIDMTTSSPSLARRISAAAEAAGADALDAPVSGGPAGAAGATLSIMLGGRADVVERVMPVLRRLGTTIVHHGEAGAGQSAKLVNQVVVGGSMLALTEAFLLARESGLDAEKVLETLGAGIAGSGLLRFMWPRIAAGDIEPGFRVAHLVKDLDLALAAAAEGDLEVPGTALVRELYDRIRARGLGDAGTQSLIRALDDRGDGADR